MSDDLEQAPSETIDRHSPVPYYQQLVGILERRISSGSIAAGDRLPSEPDLGATFGLSRATVRQALQALQSHGLVERIPNRGVFASEPQVDTRWLIQGPEGFLDSAIGHQNRAVATRVDRHGPVTLPDYAAKALQTPVGSTGHELVRVRSVDGTPALFSINYSPAELIPVISKAAGVLEGTASFSELLRQAGYPLTGATRVIHAVPAPAEVAAALRTSGSTPMLRVRSTSWTSAGAPYDFYETWVLSEVIPLEISVSAVTTPR